MQFFSWIGNFTVDAIKVILVLGFLIFIHELGHFLVAKKVGIKVHEFALGFGKKLWSFQKGETLYAVRLIPLGGYVKMEGEEEQSEDERAFNKKSIWQRMMVVFAGPIMNILVAVIVFMVLNMMAGGYVSNTIMAVEPLSDAANNLKAGDEIIKLNDKTIHIKDEINWLMRDNKGEEVKLTVLRNGQQKELFIKPFMKLNFEISNSYQNKAKNINITSDKQNVVSKIDEDSVLDKLGLRHGDKIISISGVAVNNQEDIRKALQNAQDDKIVLTLERNNRQENVSINLPDLAQRLMGFYCTPVIGNIKGLLYNSYWKTVFVMKVTVVETAKLLMGKNNINQMMGPVGIASEISNTVTARQLLYLAGIISLGLGIANLIPFPPLDGGKIVILTIEALRRKPISPEKEAAISMVGFSLLIMLMLVVMYNDILRMSN